MNQLSTLVATLAAVLTFKVEVAQSKCHFPKFLGEEDGYRPWVADITEGKLVAYAHKTVLTISEGYNGALSNIFEKHCVKRGPDNKFVVRVEEKRKRSEDQYQCLQFVNRSENIVQIKASRLYARQSMEMCNEENMAIDPYPLIDLDQHSSKKLGQKKDQVHVCPFVGGYNFYAYRPHPNNSLVCSNNRLLMRMEGECEQGGGIEFNFRKVACVPEDLPLTPIQRFKCVTHWSQGDYTFIVLKHADKGSKVWWCLRTSNLLNDLKEAYLWMHVVCDASPVPDSRISQNYLKLSFERVVYSSTCADEIQVCSGAPHVCEANYKQHCALTCQQCRSEAEIGMCTFEEQFRGRWMDTGLGGDNLLDIETYTIRGGKIGTYNCLKLDDDVQEYRDKKVFLETYDNGCLPRYACGEMSKVNSSVMRFRLGDRHVWPLPTPRPLMGGQGVRESQKEYLCKKNNFQIRLRAESKYTKERPPRLLVDTQKIRKLPCGIPEELQNGVSFTEDGRRCGGCLYYNPQNDVSGFIIRPNNCHENVSSAPNPSVGPAQFQAPSAPIHYSCITTFNWKRGTTSVVTKRTFSPKEKGMGQYHMWNFINNTKIQVMSASEAFVFEMNKELKPEYIQVQFTISTKDRYKCRMQSTTTVSTTTTTTTAATTMIVHPKTPHGGKGNKGDKYSYTPGNPDKKGNQNKPNHTPYPTHSGNLRGGTGKSPASVYHCPDTSFYVILLMTSLIIFATSKRAFLIT